MSPIRPDGHPAVEVDAATALDHAVIEQEQVVDRYLMGRLPREEAASFERHYLSCPRCLDQLELSGELLDGMRHAATQDIERSGVAATLLLALRRLGRRRVPLAALAVVCLLLPTGLLYQRLRGVSGELEGLRAGLHAPRVNLPLLTLSPRRGDLGGEPSHRLRLPSEPGSIVLSLELALPPGATYRGVLSDATGEVRWRGDGLLADPTGNLVLGFPTAFFPPGDHLLRIDDPATGEPLAHFPLRVLPPR